ncbi:hypothetical protein HYPSUDRAFT_774366 [Hypholoma sublateritium FD-334 SS-4]|uniref:Uncharacterized protein n=1 Tax=Hypholoma sublateritium (strain FD-334 SS-4) TaxID=945553 RepID=A0A0D2L277_HYPSF|nr:hypothetical protein HYPSUDRAFT_774366 [Hypholoma sublateritium FD-334 SS-4]
MGYIVRRSENESRSQSDLSQPIPHDSSSHVSNKPHCPSPSRHNAALRRLCTALHSYLSEFYGPVAINVLGLGGVVLVPSLVLLHKLSIRSFAAMRLASTTFTLFLSLVLVGASSPHGSLDISARHNRLAQRSAAAPASLQLRASTTKKCKNRVNNNAPKVGSSSFLYAQHQRSVLFLGHHHRHLGQSFYHFRQSCR